MRVTRLFDQRVVSYCHVKVVLEGFQTTIVSLAINSYAAGGHLVHVYLELARFFLIRFICSGCEKI
jgi:hypothetical protein